MTITNSIEEGIEKKVLSLRAIKGPLDDEWLGYIAELYGSLDPKYASIEYCRRLFNDNPIGYSVHVFAVHASGMVVGHYGVIPIEINIAGERKRSGKPEAYLIKKEYRTYFAKYKGKNIPAGIAIPMLLIRFAFEHKIHVLHIIAPDDVGMIHKRTGYHVLEITFDRYYFLNAPIKNPSAIKWLLGNGVYVLQNALFRLIKVFTGAKRFGCINGNRLETDHLDLICQELARSQKDFPHSWCISRDPETVRWYLSIGLLQVVMDSENPENFAVIRKCSPPGANLIEIVHWKGSLSLLARIIQEAKKQQGDLVIFNSHSLPEESSTLPKISRFFGFFPRHQKMNFYVQSPDPYFTHKKNLRFHPFFYTIF